MKKLYILIFLFAFITSLYADNFTKTSIEQELDLVKTAIKDLIFTSQVFDFTAINFEKEMPIHIELSLKSLDTNLFTESYYNLSFYMLAKANFRYELALKAIDAELAQQEYKPLKHWLNNQKKELLSLIKANKIQNFDLDSEFKSLKKILN